MTERQSAVLTPEETNPVTMFGDRIVSSGPAGSTTPGRLMWTHDVGTDGAARYTLPLWTPEGVLGMKPNLALAYNSRGGTGALGPRWSLEGLSVIRRCSRNRATDGQTGGIDFQPSVGFIFCLDNERLVRVAGNSGATNSEYRPEKNPFTKVVIVGTDSRGPTSFKVFQAAGRIAYYGRAAQSRAEGPVRNNFLSPATQWRGRYAWYLDKVEDRKQNSMLITYGPVTADSPSQTFMDEMQPSLITYGGVGDNVGRRQVRFVYRIGDSPVRHVRGLRIRTNRALLRIEMVAPTVKNGALVDDVVRAYLMDYERPTTSGRLLLKSVKQCDGATSSAVCQAPTTFTWETTVPQFREMTTPITDVVPTYTGLGADPNMWGRIIATDVNGDGRDDIVYRTDADTGDGCKLAWYVRLSNGTDFGPRTRLSFSRDTDPNCPAGPPPAGVPGGLVTPIPLVGDILAADLDGDGRSDFIVPSGAWETVYKYDVHFSNAAQDDWTTGIDSFTKVAVDDATSQTVAGSPAIGLADMNADGVIELVRPAVRPTPTSPYWIRFPITRTGRGPGTPMLERGNPLVMPMQFDLDDDGYAEQLWLNTAGTGFTTQVGAFVLQQCGIPAFPPTSVGPGGMNLFADVNGDGLKDLITVTAAQSGSISVRLNTGQGFASAVTTALPSGSRIGLGWTRNLDSGIRVVDHNQDGREDLMLVDNGVELSGAFGQFAARRSQIVVLLSTDTTAFTPTTLPLSIGTHADGALGVATPFHGYRYSQTLDVNGDGLTDLVQVRNGKLVLYLMEGKEPDVVKLASEGMSATVQFEYAHLNDPTVATPSHPSACWGIAPARCATRGLWVTKKVTTAGAASRSWTFSYDGSFVDTGGRGFLGFSQRTMTDSATGTRTVESFVPTSRSSWANKYIYPDALRPTYTQTLTRIGTRFSVVDRAQSPAIELRPNGTFSLLPDGSVGMIRSECIASSPTAWICNDLPQAQFLTFSSEERTYDAYGNLRRSTQQVGKADSNWLSDVDTTVDIGIRPANESLWLVSLPDYQQTTVLLANGETTTRRVDFIPNLTTGELTEQIVQPSGTDAEYRRTIYNRDGRGRVEGIRQVNRAGVARVSSIGYDNVDGVYPMTMVNAAGHTTHLWHHPALGVLTREKDPNGLVSRYQYDTFGRIRNSNTPETGVVDVTYASPHGVNLDVTTSPVGGPQVKRTYDSLGREIIRTEKNGAGAEITFSRAYTATGLPSFFFGPSGGTATPSTATIEYDNLGRVTGQCRDDDSTMLDVNTPVQAQVCTTTTYTGFDETTTDETARRTLVTRDTLGRPKRTIRYDGGREVVTTFAYRPFDLLGTVRTSGNANLDTELQYDSLGREKKRFRTGTGWRQTDYNAFGDVVADHHQNASGAVEPGMSHTYDRDALGRPTVIHAPEGDIHFGWDLAAMGIGKLSSTSVPARGIATTHAYDSRGLPSATHWSIGAATYRIAQTYDTLGRQDVLTYPSVAGWADVAVKHEYDGNTGRLRRLVRQGTNQEIWRAEQRHDAGQVEREVLGNGVGTRLSTYYPFTHRPWKTTTNGGLPLRLEYYADGNIRERGQQDAVERFTYDGLDRLKTWTPDALVSATNSVTYGYDDVGNLRSRAYLNETATYDGNPVLQSLRIVRGGTTTVENYRTDGWGRLYETPRGTVAYDTFDRPRSFTGGADSATFEYDGLGERIVRDSPQAFWRRIVSLRGLFEDRTTSASRESVFPVMAEGRRVAEIKRVDPAHTEETTYHLQNHIGTVVGGVTQTGGLFWSGRRDPFGSLMDGGQAFLASDARAAVSGLATRFSYAGHDHHQETGFIDMKARLYHPRIGRFSTADPVIGYPFNGQAHNPHSYALNNPVKYRDPDGRVAEAAVITGCATSGPGCAVVAGAVALGLGYYYREDLWSLAKEVWGYAETGWGYVEKGWHAIFGGGGGGSSPEPIVVMPATGPSTGVAMAGSGGTPAGRTTASLVGISGPTEGNKGKGKSDLPPAGGAIGATLDLTSEGLKGFKPTLNLAPPLYFRVPVNALPIDVDTVLDHPGATRAIFGYDVAKYHGTKAWLLSGAAKTGRELGPAATTVDLAINGVEAHDKIANGDWAGAGVPSLEIAFGLSAAGMGTIGLASVGIAGAIVLTIFKLTASQVQYNTERMQRGEDPIEFFVP